MRMKKARKPLVVPWGGVILVLALQAVHPGCSPPEPGASAPQRAVGTPPFANVSAAAGLDFSYVNGMTGQRYFVEMSGGGALFDYDNDGDLVVFSNDGPARLLRNEIGQERPWLGPRLGGVGGRDMLGAHVALLRAGAPTRWRRVHTDGSYASASDPRVRFGLDAAPAFDAVRLVWPGGTVEAWNRLEVNRYHTLVQGQGKPVEAL